MRPLVPLCLALCVLLLPATARPRVNPRVARAMREAGPGLKQLFQAAGVSYPPRRVLIRIFKHERVLELWARGAEGKYRRVRDYPVCAASGALGPKRRQGDMQVPEGFYHVRVFNPWSAYHLSLGINYPNRSDRVLGHRANLGGAIMIHGNCVSIGCVAITDKLVRQVYLAAWQAWRRSRRPVAVHIYPTRLDARGIVRLERSHTSRPGLLAFWRSLQPAYRYFEKHRALPRIRIDRRGRYHVAPARKLEASARRGTTF